MNKAFLKSFTLMSFITFVSRVIGYIRDFIFAFILGATPIADAFLLAFRIPNFFRRFLADGAINNAFVPLYIDIKKEDGEEKAQLFVGEFFILLSIVLIILVILIEFFILDILSFLAPGFSNELLNKTAFLASIMMPYLIFISISSLIGAMLNANGRYALWSFSPVVLNLCMILGMVYSILNNLITEIIIAWAVLLAGLIQFMILFFWIKIKKIKITLSYPRVSKKIKNLFYLLLPNFLAGGIIQINQFIGVFFASSISGAISWLYYSDRIVQLPLGIFAISISTILLTSLSNKKNAKKIRKSTLDSAFVLMLSLSILCMCGLLVLSDLIVDILFKRGNFGYGDAKATSDALIMYAYGLPAFCLIKLFSTVFFTRKDTKTPFYISFFTMFLNIILINILIKDIGHLGIALSLSISSWVNVVLLYIGLNIKKYWLMDISMMLKILKLVLVTVITFFTLNIFYFVFIYYDLITLSDIYGKVLFLIFLIIITVVTFLIFSFLFKLSRISNFKKSFLREL